MSAIVDPRREPRPTPLVLDVALKLDDSSRQAAIAEWTRRMLSEQAASRAFAGLLPQMMRAGVDAGYQAAVADAVVDELRHARLCAAVVDALGAEARPPLFDTDDVARHDGVGALEGLLRNVLDLSCLEETVEVALLENRYRHARESTFRRVIAEILDDEIAHSRLGWRLLQHLEPRVDGPMRERLNAYLVTAFARLFERRGVPRPPCGGETAVLAEVVYEVIVPRLEAFDMPARSAIETALATPGPDDEALVWAGTD